MRVVYSPHLKDRIKIRNFNENDPRVIFYRADKKYFVLFKIRIYLLKI